MRLLAEGILAAGDPWRVVVVALVVVVAVVVLIFFMLFLKFFRLWLQAKLSRANVKFSELSQFRVVKSVDEL